MTKKKAPSSKPKVKHKRGYSKARAEKSKVNGAKLKKSDPAFYEKLGALGGKRTAAAHDSEYYARIAILSHQSRREKKAETMVAVEMLRRGLAKDE